MSLITWLKPSLVTTSSRSMSNKCSTRVLWFRLDGSFHTDVDSTFVSTFAAGALILHYPSVTFTEEEGQRA